MRIDVGRSIGIVSITIEEFLLSETGVHGATWEDVATPGLEAGTFGYEEASGRGPVGPGTTAGCAIPVGFCATVGWIDSCAETDFGTGWKIWDIEVDDFGIIWTSNVAILV